MRTRGSITSVRLPISVAARFPADRVESDATPLHAATAPALSYVSGSEAPASIQTIIVPGPAAPPRPTEELRPGSLGTRVEQLAGIVGIRAANLSIDILDTDRFLAALNRNLSVAATTPGQRA